VKDLRRMSRRTVIYPTMICNLKCPFCYYRFLQNKIHVPFEMMKVKIDTLEDYYIEAVDITGGEPTVYPHLKELVSYCKEKGLTVTVITNATQYQLVKDLADIGLDEFLISIHGTPKVHERMVDAKVWSRVENFLKECKEYNIPYRINCVVTKVNLPYLKETAKFYLTLEAPIVNFIVFNPHPGTLWSDKINVEFQERYSLVAKGIKEAIDILDKDIWVNVRYIPMCTMKGYEHHVTNFLQSVYEPYEWECLSQFKVTKEKVRELAPKLKNEVFGTNDLEIVMNYYRRKDIERNIWTKKCMSCANRFICDGIYPQYYKRFRDKEFEPYTDEIKLDPIYYRKKDTRWLG